MKARRRLGRKTILLASILVVPVVAVVLANAGYYAGSSYSGKYCTSCHQIRTSYERWAESAHRQMDCKECHGSAFTTNLEMHAANLRHLFYQVSGRIPDRIVLKDRQVDRIAANCARCHQDKRAQWAAGGHSVKYQQIFLSARHNEQTRPMDDCLRCHGMFAETGVGDIVTPLDNTGPWRLVDPAFAERATIPCLACHTMHSRGTPSVTPNYLEPKNISYGRTVLTTSLGFYDRRERRHFIAADLPMPRMQVGERTVKMSPDPRQALCYQCHSPVAVHQVATGDDRTPIGVHEGISCLGCHDPHTLDARAACANCHPSLSNCGLDVATMDTTFKSARSAHNVHFVACADCHPKGVPKGRRHLDRGQNSRD